MAPYLDWFQVMAYAVSLYLEQVDPSKIVFGAPLYGHSWKGVPDGGDGGLNAIGTGAGVASYGDQYGNISYWQNFLLADCGTVKKITPICTRCIGMTRPRPPTSTTPPTGPSSATKALRHFRRSPIADWPRRQRAA